jgi:hypothetical protein
MRDAESLRLHVPGNSVTVRVPVIDGIALADFDLEPTQAVPIHPAGKIAFASEVLDASGRSLATCGRSPRDTPISGGHPRSSPAPH